MVVTGRERHVFDLVVNLNIVLTDVKNIHTKAAAWVKPSRGQALSDGLGLACISKVGVSRTALDSTL